MGSRVVLAMSGGVDSSVAAALLKAEGHEVLGVFMRTGGHDVAPERRAKTCCSATDAIDAQRVADCLDIPFYALDFEHDFGRIKEYFAAEYLAGRTPNPCVMCNIWLKFGKLWAYGQQVGADLVATGHYARIQKADDQTYRVARAVDRAKDQSYVLFGLDRDLLPRVRFPVGDFTKSEIRAIAREYRLPVHDKLDSQDICFVPDDDYLGFIRSRHPDRRNQGPIVDEEGAILGEHQGIEGFTIGQRRGLGIATGSPRYVVQIEPRTRTVTVGKRESLDKIGLTASRFNWQGPTPTEPIACAAQIRAQHRAVAATAQALAHDQTRVLFESPQPAITPGQVVTIYQGDLVLGGGWIETAIDVQVSHS